MSTEANHAAASPADSPSEPDRALERVTLPGVTPEPPTDGQARAFGMLALVALIVLVRIALPVGVGIFLGALLGFTLQPFEERIRRRGWSRGAAALTCALGAMLLTTVVFAGLVALFITRGVALVEALPGLLGPGGALRKFAESVSTRLSSAHLDPMQLTGRLQEEAMSLGSKAAAIAAQLAGATFAGVLTLFFMTFATYVVLRDWNSIVEYAEETFPFEPRHSRALLGQFRTVGRQVLSGTIITGVVQGVFAGVGYWMTGIPDPAFFGALTAVASLVPAIGTLLVWVPAGIYLMMTGHIGAGVIELVYAALTVGIVSDYVIRPKLVGSEKGVPTILTFVALFGGVEVFGIIGLILGPVIVTLCVAVLQTYQREVSAARGAMRV